MRNANTAASTSNRAAQATRAFPRVSMMMDDRAPAIESPCIGVCQVDGRTQSCIGCGRSLDEIARWLSFSDAERRAIMERLAADQRPDEYDG
jgi:uncharacterized protein